MERDAEALLQFEDFKPTSTSTSGPPPSYEQTITFSKFPTSQVDIDIEDEEVPTKRRRKHVLHPVAILDSELTNPVLTVKVWTARIVDKKATSGLVKKLSEVLPIFNHLKRVKSSEGRLNILIDKANDSASQCAEKLREKGLNLEALDSCEKWNIVEVPRCQPSSRTQYDAALKEWPCSFHEDPILERLLNRTFFTPEVLECKFRHMKLSWAISQHTEDVTWNVGDDTGFLSRFQLKTDLDSNSSSACNGSSGAVFVDPTTNSIVAAASLKSVGKHPLKHTVMVAIDLVARSQGGGAWYVGQSETSSDSGGKPYLCTDYDVYLTDEPCIMCCMALLHSRVKCIFFSQPKSGGGLLSAVRLHTLAGINHRFLVFQGLNP